MSTALDTARARSHLAAPTPGGEVPSYWNTERIVGWSLVGAATAAAGFAVYFGIQRHAIRDQYQWQELERNSHSMANQLHELEADYDRATTNMFTASIAAVGFAGFGVVCLILGERSQPKPLAAQPELAVDATSARFGLVGRF